VYFFNRLKKYRSAEEAELHEVRVKVLGLLVVEAEPVLVIVGTDLHRGMDGRTVRAATMNLLEGLGGEGEPGATAVGTGRALVEFLGIVHVLFLFYNNFFYEKKK
jgi:hypothetical protein